MERGDNKNRAKNWLYRILKIKKHANENNCRNVTSDFVQVDLHSCNNLSPITRNTSSGTCLKTRNSFRKSFRKMQTRVKSCVFRQKLKTTTDYPESSATPIQSPAIMEQQPSSSSDRAVQQSHEPPPLPKRTNLSPARHPVNEIINLSKSYWYWGPMSTAEAEEKLKLKPDGAFLVRDSSSTSYLFSLSFRSVGKTKHARIEYNRGKYNLFGYATKGFATITELIDDAMSTSENGVYCYSIKNSDEPEFPVRLTQPISRYTQVRSLKYLCKFVIRQYTNINDIPKLPLPTVLYSYLQEGPYF